MSLNFVTKEGASREEINAVVERGLDAMMNGATDVVFSIDGPGYTREPTNEQAGPNTKKVKVETDEARQNVLNNAVTNEVVEDIVSCPGCEEHPCVFTSHRENLVAYDEAEHSCLALEDIPDNNLRRKKLYRQLTLMINEGPLGAKVRRPLPSCCVTAIRDMLPSDTYMGFREE
jgi:hypothetical protein